LKTQTSTIKAPLFSDQVEKTVDLRDTLSISDVRFDQFECPQEFYGNIQQLRVHDRPLHSNIIPIVRTEEKEGKTVSHNYGHGPFGWTVLFGNVNHSILNFEKFLIDKKADLEDIKQTKEVSVLGMGCFGLTTALTLHYRGYKKIRVIAENKDMLISHMAGGLINYVPLDRITCPRKRELLNNWMLDTHMTCKAISEGNHIFSELLKDDIQLINLYTDHVDYDDIGLTYLASLNIVERPKRVKLILGTQENPIISEEHFHIKAYLIHSEKYLKHVYDQLERLGIPCEQRKVESFGEVNSEFIFNCTAFGSKQLNDDNNLLSACGHGLILANQDLSQKLDFVLIYRSTVPGLKGHPADGTVYFMPKKDNLFLGGTYMRDYDGSNRRINQKEWSKLCKRARWLFHGVHPDDQDSLKASKVNKKERTTKGKLNKGFIEEKLIPKF